MKGFHMSIHRFLPYELHQSNKNVIPTSMKPTSYHAKKRLRATQLKMLASSPSLKLHLTRKQVSDIHEKNTRNQRYKKETTLPLHTLEAEDMTRRPKHFKKDKILKTQGSFRARTKNKKTTHTQEERTVITKLL